MTKRMHPMLGEVDDELTEEPADVIERKTITHELSDMIGAAAARELNGANPRFGHYCEVCGQYDGHKSGCPTQATGQLRPDPPAPPEAIRRPRIRRLLGELLRAVADRLEGKQ